MISSSAMSAPRGSGPACVRPAGPGSRRICDSPCLATDRRASPLRCLARSSLFYLLMDDLGPTTPSPPPPAAPPEQRAAASSPSRVPSTTAGTREDPPSARGDGGAPAGHHTNRSPDVPSTSLNPYAAASTAASTASPAAPTPSGPLPGLDFETQLRQAAGPEAWRGARGQGYVPRSSPSAPHRPLPAHRARPPHHAPPARGPLGPRHPVAITTKGTLIERDLDLLAPMAERGSSMWACR
jgi:hypothetical protein